MPNDYILGDMMDNKRIHDGALENIWLRKAIVMKVFLDKHILE